MHPNTTRRALRPLSITRAGSPRSDHIARKGGNSSKSVSSSTNTTLFSGKPDRMRQIWRFFLSLWVGCQHVPRSFPYIAEPMQIAPNGVFGIVLSEIFAQLVA